MQETISVLLVDDDDDLRDIVRGILGAAPDIEMVGDVGLGVEGIEEAIRQEPDVIVLDYMMPGMSGDIVAAAVRDNSPRTKILVFTAILEQHPDWADDFLAKLDIAELPDRIRNLARMSSL